MSATSTGTYYQRTTLESFAQYAGANSLSELIDGRPLRHPLPGVPHQQAALAVAAFLRQKGGQRGTTTAAPLDLYPGGESLVRPDVVWVRHRSEKCQLRGGTWFGAPDIVVEVMSAPTRKFDRGIKFDLYERVGVREYWLVDYSDVYLEVYRLEQGRLARQGLFGPGDVFRSTPLVQEVAYDALFA